MCEGVDRKSNARTAFSLSKVANLVLISTIITLTACSSDGDEQPSTSCVSTAADSSFNGVSVNRIRSENIPPNTYEEITVRSGVTMDYMVHTHPSPKALIILIAGGQLNSQIEGNVGMQATNASGNFLVTVYPQSILPTYRLSLMLKTQPWDCR